MRSVGVHAAGGVPADWQDFGADDEYRGRHQGLDAHLLLVLPLPRAGHRPQPGGICLLLFRHALMLRLLHTWQETAFQ